MEAEIRRLRNENAMLREEVLLLRGIEMRAIPIRSETRNGKQTRPEG